MRRTCSAINYRAASFLARYSSVARKDANLLVSSFAHPPLPAASFPTSRSVGRTRTTDESPRGQLMADWEREVLATKARIRVNRQAIPAGVELDKRACSSGERVRRTMNRAETRDVLDRELRLPRTLHILKSRDVRAPFRYEIRPSRPDNPRPPRIYLDRVRRYFGIGLYCYRRPRKPV